MLWPIRINVIILTLNLFLFCDPGFTQRITVTTNPHVKYEVSEETDHYIIDYVFKDPFDNFQHFSISYPVELTNRMISRFGIPNWMFDKYIDTEANVRYRQDIMNEGLFMLESNIIKVDKSSVIDYYSGIFCKPIAEMITQALSDYGQDTRRNRIEMAMRFVQDIPYGIPKFSDQKRHYGGVSPPPQLLIQGFGDCDSKVLLFTGILVYLIEADDIIFLNQPQHVLSAIKASPDESSTFVRHQGNKYLLAETAGPGHRKLGEKGSYYRNTFEVEVLKIRPTEQFDYKNNPEPVRSLTNNVKIESNEIMIKNVSGKNFRFQLSYDNVHWEEFLLSEDQSGTFILEDQQMILLRYREKKSKSAVFRIHSGNSYTVLWNNRKRKWECVKKV